MAAQGTPIGNVSGMTDADLEAAAAAIDLAHTVVGRGVRHLAEAGGPDAHQLLAYDLAHSAAVVETARSMLDYGAKGHDEADPALAGGVHASIMARRTGDPVPRSLTTPNRMRETPGEFCR